MSVNDYINKLFDKTIQEVTVKPRVTQDPKTANLSGQAPIPGDGEAEKKMKEGDITTDDIVEKINALRAGHSLKDQDVYADLDKYVTDLDVAEKTSLFAFLKGISEIVSRQKTGDVAVEPSDPQPNVEMQKNNINTSTSGETKKVNVNIKHDRGGGGEKINAPLPIKPIQK